MGPLARGNKAYTEEYILEKALQNLEKVDAIGITAELNKLIYQVSYAVVVLPSCRFCHFVKNQIIQIFVVCHAITTWTLSDRISA
jgi:hypothetical protein